MQIRSFGNTNLRLSAMTLDAGLLSDVDEALRRAYAAGATSFLVPGEPVAAAALGRALQAQELRERVYLMAWCDYPNWGGDESLTEVLDPLLERVGTDYLDLVLLRVDGQLDDPSALQALARQLERTRRTGGGQNFAATGDGGRLAAALETGLFQGLAARPGPDIESALAAVSRAGHGFLALLPEAPVDEICHAVGRPEVTSALVAPRRLEELDALLQALKPPKEQDIPARG